MAGESAILQELRQIKEGQNDLRIKVGKIETQLKYHLIGLGLLLTIMIWLHTDQNARISRMENRLDANFAIQRTTACQCEKEN